MSINPEQDQIDFEALSAMIKRAEEQHLLVEVLWTYSHRNNKISIPERCASSLYEWDC